MRYFYTLLLYLSCPWLLLRLWWKSKRYPSYEYGLLQRLGFYPFKLNHCLWVHAVSVGEVIAAAPLINKLITDYKNSALLITTTTATGAQVVKDTFGFNVHHAYLPYDLPDANKRFLQKMRPKIAILMETELWPNLLSACKKSNIPVCLLNARLSAKSWRGYNRISKLTQEMLGNIQMIGAQGKDDLMRFKALGAHNVSLTGNIKFDLRYPQDLPDKSEKFRRFLGKNRFIWIAASTHTGEEEIILKAHQIICRQHNDALLILVPRHPERFDEVTALAKTQFKIMKRSDQKNNCSSDVRVFIGDTMGELPLMYASADVALVGGSLVPRGGHNLLEPAALKKPIISGEGIFNFAEISQMLVANRALIFVQDADSIAAEILKLIADADLRHALGERAFDVVTANRGVLEKQMAIVKSLI